MGVGAEAFTVLAVFKAQDRASEIYDKVQLKLDQLAGTFKKTADAADVSGAKIDESLLATASGADALSLATAKVEAAQARLTAANKEQADSERALLDAQEQSKVAADGDTEAMDRQIAAADKLAVSQKETAKATKGLRDAQADQKAITEAQSTTTEISAKKTESAGSKLGAVASTMGKVGLGVALAGGLMVKAGGDFQSSTEHLVTDAGESQSQLGKVQSGMLGIAAATGTSAKDISAGMYHIESSVGPMASASERAKIVLNELQVASQGAKVGGADLDTVSKTLAGTMNSYAKQGYTATQMMNALISTTGAGDMKMQDLASSLGSVSGVAASAGLDFSQVGGAIATMTSQNWTADRATQDLANTIGALQKPLGPATAQMQQLGLNVNNVSMNLGKRGLTGTFDVLTQAIASHTKGGQVLIDTLKNSQAAASDATIMFGKLPVSIQGAAKSLMDGKSTAADFNKSLKDLDAPQQHLAKQFEQLIKSSGSFNTLLKNGGPAAETFNAAMGTMLGGSTGLNTALALTGDHMAAFKASTNTVGAALASKSKDVENWSAIQGTFNQKMSEAKASVETTGITIGMALLPAVTSLLKEVMAIIDPIASWVQGHQKLTVIILGAVAGLGLLVGTINLAVKAYKVVKGAVQAVGDVVKGVGKLLGLYSDSQIAAAASADAAAASADGLAASEDGATASTEASTVAADGNSAGWIRSGLAAAGAAVKFVALKVAQIAGTVATWAATAATWALNAAMAVLTSPITLVVVAIAALAAGVIYAYEHFTAFRQIVDAVFSWLKSAVTDVIGFVKDHWQMIVEIITGPIVLVSVLVEQHWDQIKGIFTRAVGDIIGFLTYWFVGLPLKFAGWLASAAAAVGRGVAEVLVWWVELPGKVEGAIWGFFGGLAGNFAIWVGNIAISAAGKGVDLLNWFISLPGKIASALGDLSQTLWNAGASLISGLIGGIESMFGHVKDTLTGLVGDITSWKGPPEKDAILLTANGKLIIQGLVAGFDQGIPAVHAKLQGLTASIQQTVTPTLPALPAAGAGAAISGGTVNNFNLSFDGAHVMNDRDMDMFAQKISASIAQHLPAGGLRIAM